MRSIALAAAHPAQPAPAWRPTGRGRLAGLPRFDDDAPPEWAAVEGAAPEMLEFANPRVIDTFTSSLCVDN
jgi:hypothetical protein